MPKKRFTSQYSKPPSTVHPSLNSHATSSSSGQTPVPRARIRRPFDANGRRVPPGPSAPSSWLESSRCNSIFGRSPGRSLPKDVKHLPGLPDADRKSSSLQNTCLREIARQWKFFRELKNLLVFPPVEDERFVVFDTGEHNSAIFRVDLSGAMGKSISFKQLIELVKIPEPPAEVDSSDLSWDDNSLARSLSPIIPNLTHLSLSHPASSISWSRLLSFAKHVPNLTHLSLAFWPVPSLTSNAQTTVVASKYGPEVQYGGTNYYSHTLENDFREAAEVLCRFADRLSGLQYLDLTGCPEWIRALGWMGVDGKDRSVDWGNQWIKLHTLIIRSGTELSGESEFGDVAHFVMAYREATVTEDMLRFWMRRSKNTGRARAWIGVQKDDWAQYKELWLSGGSEDERKRSLLMGLGCKDWVKDDRWTRPLALDPTLPQGDAAVERMSVWDQ
ncbi:tafazzin [Diplocarpon rosae]|nr:tafazzin [Diplocarpon rosae]